MGFKTQAEAVIAALNGKELNGKILEVSIHVPQNERVKSNDGFTNLFVRNLPRDFSEEKLTDLFKEFGTINS